MRLAPARAAEAPQGTAEAGAEDPTREAGVVIEIGGKPLEPADVRVPFASMIGVF